MRSIILIAHNLRSTHNIGTLLRTAEGLGVTKVYFTGYTPYPMTENDPRLPHIAAKIDKQIHKTALDAERFLPWEHRDDIFDVAMELKAADYRLAAIEQAPAATMLPDFRPPDKLALIVGREVDGLEPEVIEVADMTLEIPMFGKKESFNVVQAAAMALYHCRFR